MHTRALLPAALLSLGLGLPAQAGNQAEVIERVSPDQIETILKARGYLVERKSTPEGKVYTTFQAMNLKHSVYYYGCDAAQNCDSVQMYSGYSLNDNTGIAARINEWNRTKRLSRAYLDQENDPCIETDLHLQGGVTMRAVSLFIEDYVNIAGLFTSHINYN